MGERPGCPPAGPPAVGLGIRGAAPRSLVATVPEYGSDTLVESLSWKTSNSTSVLPTSASAVMGSAGVVKTLVATVPKYGS